jgi:hypothetical protein
MAENFAYTHDDSTPGVYITGQREDWSETVWNIAKDDIPLLNTIKRDASYSATERNWLVEDLEEEDATDSAGKVQGSSSSPGTQNRYKCTNYNMILSESAFVSRTQEKQLKYGVDSELKHQMLLKMVKLRKAVERVVGCRVRKRNPQTNTKAGLAHGLPGIAGLYGDRIMHIDGSSEKYGANNTVNIWEGLATFDEASTATGQSEFRTQLRKIWELGAKPSHCFCSILNKEYISTTWDVTNVERTWEENSKLQELVDVYKTDAGMIQFIPDLIYTAATSQTAATHDFDGASSKTMLRDFAVAIDPNLVTLLLFDDFFTINLNDLDEDGYRKRGMVEFTVEAVPQSLLVFNFAGDSTTHTPNQITLPTTAAGYVQS